MLFEFKESKKSKALDRCKCNACGWDGLPKECIIEEEQESWEMPSYLVYLCPKCDHDDVVEFYPSEEWLKENGYAD